MKKIFILIITFVFLLGGCKSIPEVREKISVNGMIYDTENRPAVNYKIFIDDELVAITDIGGRFKIENIKRGDYEFHGEGKGYISINDSLKIYDETQVLYLRVPTVEEKFREAFENLKAENTKKAKEFINLILESDSENSDAIFFMCVIEFLEGNKSNAIENIEKIKSTGEKSNYVQELEKIIKK